MQDTLRTWAEVDLDNIQHNVKTICKALGSGTRFMGVMKADGYGHGALPVARATLDAGASYLGVACLSEAESLRDGGIDAPILILGPTPPDEARRLVDLDITQAVGNLSYACELSKALNGDVLRVHMKLDTGMSRTGFDAVREECFDNIYRALTLPRLDYEGIFTHFAVSDLMDQEAFTLEQTRRFLTAVEHAEKVRGQRFKLRHCANSGAVINYRELSLDMVRPGLALYGLYPGREQGKLDLRPAMSLKSRIYAVTEHVPGDTVSYGRTFTIKKPTRLAVVPVGYADGLLRCLSGRIDMLVHGRRCPQVGRICMDMCMVDVTDLKDCNPGDVVTIFGKDGEETIDADELAEKAGTISYEILCAISPRVPRVYLKNH